MFLANKFSRNERWQIFPTDAHGARSAAATKLRRSRSSDSATESLLRRSCEDQLRRAHSAHRVSRRPALIFPCVDLNSMVVAHSPRPPPWPRNKYYSKTTTANISTSTATQFRAAKSCLTFCPPTLKLTIASTSGWAQCADLVCEAPHKPPHL